MVSFLSVFDLDHTLFLVNSSYAFGRHLYRASLLSSLQVMRFLPLYALHKGGALSTAALHRAAFRLLFRGKELAPFLGELSRFLDGALERLLYPPAYRALREAKGAGHLTLLLSASPHFIVEEIAGRLGFDGWGATPYQIDAAGRFIAIGEIMEGEAKRKWLLEHRRQLGVARERITAYSDSHLDLPLFEVVGRCVAVNPDRALRALSSKRGWPIL